MGLAGRGEVIERLLAAHEAWFDVDRDHRFAGRTFPGYAEFHSCASQYVLVKRAKLWEAASHEHLFFWDTPRLTAAELDDLIGCVTGEGLSLVQPAPDHMTTYLSLAIVADAVDDLAWERVRRTRFRKNFALGWRGWADLRLAVADLSRGRVTTNSQGKPLGKTLQANAFIDDGAAVCAAGCSGARDAACGGARDAARNTARGAVRDGHRLDASAPAFPEGREGRACDGARPLFEAQGEKRGSKL